jgi:recombination protein RecA
MAKAEQLIAALNKATKKTIGGVGLVIPDPTRIPTGIFAFDLGVGGGFPRGRCSLIYGLEASFKTTLALLTIQHHQKMYPKETCAFIDIEHHLTQSWAEMFGVDWSKLLVVHPENAEQVVDIVEGLMAAEDIGVVVIDSIAAMVTQKELDKNAEDVLVGGSGLVINKLYRKMTSAFTEADRVGHLPTVIVINQIRYKIGQMGNPETMPGGPSINFLSSLSVRVSGQDIIKKGEKMPTFKHIRVTVKKNKVPILAKNVEYLIALKTIDDGSMHLTFGQSYDWNTVLLYLKKLELLIKGDAGGWVYQKLLYDTQDALKDRYFEDPDFHDKVQALVIKTALTQGDPITESDATEA